MEMIILAAGMVAAFIAGAYVRKPFAIIKKKEAAEPVNEEKETDPEVEKAVKRINEQINELMNYTGPKRGDDSE